MNINKAIKKQKKIFKRFMLSMGFIFLFLPIILYFTKIFSVFLFVYLGIIEMLILIVMIISTDRETLKFQYVNQFKIQNGIFGEWFILVSDRVEFIHILNEGNDLKIVIILSSRLRNKRIKKIDSELLTKHSWANDYYNKIKSENVNKEYFYIEIDKGGYNKYELLDFLYKYCTKAHFTEEAIKAIKEYRN